MGLLGNGGGGLDNKLLQNIKQVKGFMKNPMDLIGNPQITQIQQMLKGQNPQNLFMNMCKEKGIDPNAILNELRK